MNKKEKNDVNNQANNKTFVTLLIITFILPWPHGGEIIWQYLIFCIGIFTLCLIYSINISKTSLNITKNFSFLKSVKVALLLLSVWLLFQLLQVVPLPIYLSSYLSNIAEQDLISNNWNTISIAPNITIIEIIKHTSYVAIFILMLLLINTKQRVLNLTNTLFFSSAIIAVYSLVNHHTNGAFNIISSIPPWTMSWEKATHGTFSYQNHYASFLTLTIPLGFGLLYSNIKKNTIQKIGKGKVVKILNLIMTINGLYLLSILIMLIALFKTASRGGNSIFVISIAITYLCIVFQQKKSKKEKIKKLTLSAISLIVVSIIIISTGVTDSLTQRLEKQGYSTSGRDLMHQTAFSIIKERPLVGAGAGTYPILQHKFKPALLGNTSMSKRAHNDYLELLTNQGIIGFSLLALATVLLLLNLFTSLKKNKDTGSLYGLQVASFCSVIAILLHSFVDFNFHLPANAIYFFIILAIGLKIPLIQSKTKRLRNT
jgi:O-antigen ligase